jgi:hypothetical protein
MDPHLRPAAAHRTLHGDQLLILAALVEAGEQRTAI